MPKFNDTRAALSWRTLYPDGPATPGDDAVHDCQAESGTSPRLLGREERLEHLPLCLLIHPAAGVTHDQPHDRHGPAPSFNTFTFSMKRCPPYGIASRALTGKVDDDLLKRPRVKLHRPELPTKGRRDLDAFPDQPLNHFEHALQHGVQANHLGRNELAAPKSNNRYVGPAPQLAAFRISASCGWHASLSGIDCSRKLQ